MKNFHFNEMNKTAKIKLQRLFPILKQISEGFLISKRSDYDIQCMSKDLEK